MKRLIGVIAGSLLVGSVWAQSASAPLNLKLPAGDLPASSASTAAAASRPTSAASIAKPAPGVYYGDTSGRMGNAEQDTASAQACDDSTYNQPQVHGSVGMGVVGGSHMSGSYQTGAVDITKNLGDCDHPTGAVSFSIGVGNGDFHDRGHRW
ncbi:MAG: hypothetical protein KGJ96_09840 [Xanthomonadaceae bacterium]|nr:hypothetical protein [Xanthomonadaceae bacterium]